VARFYTQQWLPPEPRASLIILHGYAEHVGRYDHVVEYLTQRGYAVYAYDQLGHGGSEGQRSYADSFDIWRDDLSSFIDQVRAEAAERPLFVLGHSMGGCIAAYLLATQNVELDGVLLSAPALSAGDSTPPILLKIVSIVGKLFPKLPTQAAESSTISRDPAVVTAYENDPLVYRGGVPARTAAEMLRAADVALAKAANVQCPLLIMHGASDQLISPQGSKQFYERAGAADKTLKLYDNLYHEILNEPEQEEVLEDIVTWIEDKMIG